MFDRDSHQNQRREDHDPLSMSAVYLQESNLEGVSFPDNLLRFFATMPPESQQYILGCVQPFLSESWQWHPTLEPMIYGILEGSLNTIALEGGGRSLTVVRLLSAELLRKVLVEVFREREAPELERRSFDLTPYEAVTSPHFLTLALQQLAVDLYPEYLEKWRKVLAAALAPEAMQQLLLFANESIFEADKRQKLLNAGKANVSSQERETLFHDLAFRTIVLAFGTRQDNTPRRPLTEIPENPTYAEHFLLTCARYAAEVVVSDFYKNHQVGHYALEALKKSQTDRFALYSSGYRENSATAQLPPAPEPAPPDNQLEPSRSNPQLPQQPRARLQEPISLSWSFAKSLIEDTDLFGETALRYTPAVLWGANFFIAASTGNFAPIAETFLPLLTPSVESLSAQHILLSSACMLTLHTFLKNIPTITQDNSLWGPIFAARVVSASALTNLLVLADNVFGTGLLEEGLYRGTAEFLTWFVYFIFETQFNFREDDR